MSVGVIQSGRASVELQNFYSTEFKDVAVFSRWFSKHMDKNNKNVYLCANLPFVILVRDPIVV
ncbi:hypothetical protein [Campylobacter helveticus]|uniref:hypothetical protein n=1 Tax=Campylobacter helveticus TaxID=28898 RepID=UPI0022EA403A|nr:hypothetical protein [Campylobacter helveticus]